MKIFIHLFIGLNCLDKNKIIRFFENIFMESIEIGTIENSDILLESDCIEKSFIKDKNWEWSFLLLMDPNQEIQSNNDYSCIFYNENIENIPNGHNGVILPLFVLYSYCYSVEKQKKQDDQIKINNLTHDFVKEYPDPDPKLIKTIEIPEKNICVFVSKEIDGEHKEKRDIFFDKLEEKFNIDYIGSYRKNISLFNEESCSPEFLENVSKYKIFITMEESKKNNITDKILNGFYSNTIPVYWGTEKIHDYFNKDRFLYIENLENNHIINQIEEIINDEKKIIEMVDKYIYKNNRIPFTFYNISKNIKKLLNIEKKQKNHFITFAGPKEKYHKSLNRIYRQAIEFYFFDEINIFTEDDLKNDKIFWDKHGKFIENSNRGYGYWIWKPYLIKKRLDQILDNDILIYCDAGCELNKQGINRIYEYIDLLNTNPKNDGILSFQMRYKENLYTKRKIFEYLESSEEEKTKKQCLATIIIIKKNNHSINIINKWFETASIHDLINDDKTNEIPSFVDMRHDQSIFSVLVNKYGSIKIYDETYFEEFDSHWYKQGRNYPLLARRIRI